MSSLMRPVTAVIVAGGLATLGGCTASAHSGGAPGAVVGTPGSAVSAPGSAVSAPGSAVGAPGSAVGAPGSAVSTAKPASCEYWTTAGEVSAVVVTSGVNCGTKSFTIDAAPYEGAVFSDTGGETAYNQFLSQISEFVSGPASAPAPFGGKAPSLHGLTLIGSADNEFTNYVAVYVYKGPGDVNDGAAEELDAVINNAFLPPA